MMRKILMDICLFFVLLAGVNAGWTKWLNRDTPRKSGDWERVPSFDPMPCDGAATHIQARIKGDNTIIVSASDRLSVGPKYGLLCKTSEQYDNKCLNYRVSYLLPKLSKLYNDDLPLGNGDYEEKSFLPSNEWTDGKFIYWYADDQNYGLVHERLELGPRYGLACETTKQSDYICQDYEVRFYCPV